MIKYFGDSFLKDFLKKIAIFDESGNKEIRILNKANRSIHFTEFDFSIIQFLPLFNDADILSKDEKVMIKQSFYSLNDISIKKVLLKHLDKLKMVLIERNGIEPGNEELITIIEQQIGIVYKQLSLFD